MKIKTNPNEILAILFLICVEIMYGFNYTALEITGGFHDLLLLSALLFGFIGFIIKKMNLKQFVLNVLLLSIGILVYISSKETIFILMVIAALVCQSIGYKRTLSCIFLVRIIAFIIIEIMVFLGVLPFDSFLISKGVFGAEIGFSFGYMHPNVLGQEIFFLVTLYLMIRNKKISNLELFFLFIIDFISFILTKSKTSCGLLLIIIIMTIWIKKNNYNFKKNKSIKLIVSITFVLILAIGIIMPFIYATVSGELQKIVWNLNGLLNGRLSHASTLFRSFDLTLFGKILDLEYIQSFYGYSVIDNSWVYTLFNFGIIPFICIVVLYYSSIVRLIDKNEYVFVLVIMTFLVYGLMENVLRSMYMNFVIIFWKEAIESKNKYSIIKFNSSEINTKET